MTPDVKGTEAFKRQDNPVQVIIHDLTLAQVQSWETTPVELIPAPGANEFTRVLSILSRYEAGDEAAEFGEGEENGFAASYGDDDATPASPGVGSMTLFDDTSIADWGQSIEHLPIGVVNKAVLLSGFGGDDLTAGNGTLRLIIRFVQHSIA